MNSYYVIFPDGQRFGPADVPTLNQWIVEGRLQPTSSVEDATTGQRMMAAELMGLHWPVPTGAPQPGPAASPYTRPVDPMAESWVDRQVGGTHYAILFLLSFCCGLVSLIIGIIAVVTTKNEIVKKKGIFMIVTSLVVWVLSFLFQILMLPSR
jgi:hypothetical protein